MTKESGGPTAAQIAEVQHIIAHNARLDGIAELAAARPDALTGISNGDAAIELAIGDVVSEQYEVLAHDIEAGGRALNADDFAAIKDRVKALVVVAEASNYQFAADNVTSESSEFEAQTIAQEAVIDTLGLWHIVDKVALAFLERAKKGQRQQ